MPEPRDWPRIVGVLHLPSLPGSARGGAASSICGIIDAMRRDAEIYASAHGVTLEEARRKFRQTRQRGRRASRCMEIDDDR